MKSVRLLIETLVSLPEIVADYYAAIPEGELDGLRSAEAWSLRQHLYHIVGVQEMLLGRLTTMRTEARPVITPYFPDKDAEARNQFASVSQALARYREVRAQQVEVLRACTEADFAKPATHPEYKAYSIALLVNHMVFHEYWHLYRVEELWLTKDEYFERKE
jgi:uncharacterized damage-inducible protein DinB